MFTKVYQPFTALDGDSRANQETKVRSSGEEVVPWSVRHHGKGLAAGEELGPHDEPSLRRVTGHGGGLQEKSIKVGSMGSLPPVYQPQDQTG